MPCTSSGCDIHDYPVASPWCTYKHALEQGDKKAGKLERIVDKLDQMMPYDMYEQPPSKTLPPPPSKPNNKIEEKIKWKQT
jgi:hypothetical protein